MHPLRCVGLEADLATSAAPFGDAARSYVSNGGRMVTLADIEEGDETEASFTALHEANAVGAYLLGESHELPAAVDLYEEDLESDIRNNPKLRIMPLLPFCSREAGMQYTLFSIIVRRDKVRDGSCW